MENDGHAGRRRLGRSQLVAGRLSHPNLVTSVRHALDGAGLDPRYLAVEVPEPGMARARQAPSFASESFAGWRPHAIDGFGTVHSSWPT